MTPPDDHMIPPPDHSAMTDIEADLEPILVHQGSRSSSPAANKLPQAIALQVYISVPDGIVWLVVNV